MRALVQPANTASKLTQVPLALSDCRIGDPGKTGMRNKGTKKNTAKSAACTTCCWVACLFPIIGHASPIMIQGGQYYNPRN